jgi:predicted O-methyltransferase YrrM
VLLAGSSRVNLFHRLRANNVMHYVRYRLGLDEPRTQTTPAERALLRELAAGARTIVEIGAFEGVSTRLMRVAMPGDAHLYAIDPFVANCCGFCVQHAIFRREAGRSTNGRVILMRQFSYDAIASWREPIDLLFLDGDHSFEGVTRDFREWGRHVRPGGVILVHTSQLSPAKPVPTTCGPYRLVHEVVPHETGFRVARAVDSTTVVVRM